jgi:hypothetical protein
MASIRTASLRKGAILTFLVSLTTVTLQISAILHAATRERYFGPAFLAGSFAEALLAFASGLAVCTALSVGFAFLDGRLGRRKILCERNQPLKSEGGLAKDCV